MRVWGTWSKQREVRLPAFLNNDRTMQAVYVSLYLSNTNDHFLLMHQNKKLTSLNNNDKNNYKR